MSRQFNDLKSRALGMQGYTGSVNDREVQWLQGLTGATGSVNDLWAALLDLEGIDDGALPDRKRAFFAREIGRLPTHRQDLEYDYWLSMAGG